MENAPKCQCGYCNENADYAHGKYQKYTHGHASFKWKEEQYIKKYGIPKCKTCGEPVNFKRGVPNKYCSIKCRPSTWNQDKCKKTLVKNYGVENPMFSEKIKNHKKYNHDKKYGVEHNWQRKDIKEKIKQTNLEKYGVENPMQNNEIKLKAEKTVHKNWGGYTYSSDILSKKVKQTNLEKYGVENPMQNNEIKLKAEKTANRLKKFKDTNIWYQGSYELDFLERYYNKFPDIQRGPSFKYKFKNKNKVYHSDFYIPSMNLIVEIKNSYLYNRDKDILSIKKQSVINKNYNYILILDKDYSEFLEIMS